MITGCGASECPTVHATAADGTEQTHETCCFDLSSCASMAQSTIAAKLPPLPEGETALCLPSQISELLGGFPAYCTCN